MYYTLDEVATKYKLPTEEFVKYVIDNHQNLIHLSPTHEGPWSRKNDCIISDSDARLVVNNFKKPPNLVSDEELERVRENLICLAADYWIQFCRHTAHDINMDMLMGGEDPDINVNAMMVDEGFIGDIFEDTIIPEVLKKVKTSMFE